MAVSRAGLCCNCCVTILLIRLLYSRCDLEVQNRWGLVKLFLNLIFPNLIREKGYQDGRLRT